MAPWYRQDSFLTQPGDGTFDPQQPGNIGGVKSKPAQVAEPPVPKVVEFFSTDEAADVRTETAQVGDAVSPVATDDNMSENMLVSPGRGEDGEVEGEVSLYTPFDGADNLFSVTDREESMEGRQ